MRRNIYKLLWILPLVLFVGSTAWAQDSPKGEVSFTVGWTFSDGVSGDGVLAVDGNIYDRIDTQDAFSWGFTGEYFITDNAEVGFRFNRQQSKLEVGGTTTTEIGDINVDNYHGIFSYNFGDPHAQARPFLFGGIGATNFGGVDFDFNGPRSIGGQTKFSTTWGAGLKFYASQNVGLRLQLSWTPTYIKSDSEGWWCDPFWGCYVVGNTQYSNQFEMGGGVTFRF